MENRHRLHLTGNNRVISLDFQSTPIKWWRQSANWLWQILVDVSASIVNFPTPIVDEPTSIPKAVIITKTIAQKSYAECTNWRTQDSHSDYFRDHLCACVSGPLSGNSQTTFRRLLDNICQNSRALFGNLRGILLKI